MDIIKNDQKIEPKKGIVHQLYAAFFENPQWYFVWFSGLYFIGVVVFGMELCNMYCPAVYEVLDFYDPSTTEEDTLFAYWYMFALCLTMFAYTTYHTLQLRKKILVWEKRDKEESEVK